MRELLHELNCKKRQNKIFFRKWSKTRNQLFNGLITEFASMCFYNFSTRPPDNMISYGLCSPVARCWNFFLAISIIAALVLSLKNGGFRQGIKERNRSIGDLIFHQIHYQCGLPWANPRSIPVHCQFQHLPKSYQFAQG